jgi:hypothetical protein
MVHEAARVVLAAQSFAVKQVEAAEVRIVAAAVFPLPPTPCPSGYRTFC